MDGAGGDDSCSFSVVADEWDRLQHEMGENKLANQERKDASWSRQLVRVEVDAS